MAHSSDHAQLTPGGPHDRQRWQLRAGPTGSPRRVPRTPDNLWPNLFIPYGIPIDPYDISIERPRHPATPLSLLDPYTTALGQEDQRPSGLDYGIQNGGLDLSPKDDLQAQADELSCVIRNSLGAANEKLETILKQHRQQVASLETQLAGAKEETEMLTEKLAESASQSAMENRQINALDNELSKERSTSEYLRARVHYFERKSRSAIQRDEGTRAEKDRLKDDVADLRSADAQQIKALVTTDPKKNVKQGIQVFIFLQGRRRTLTTWYDTGVYFVTVLNDYARETEQDPSRLNGHHHGSADKIELNDVFVVQAGRKRRAYLVRIEVTEHRPAKKRRMA